MRIDAVQVGEHYRTAYQMNAGSRRVVVDHIDWMPREDGNGRHRVLFISHVGELTGDLMIKNGRPLTRIVRALDLESTWEAWRAEQIRIANDRRPQADAIDRVTRAFDGAGLATDGIDAWGYNEGVRVHLTIPQAHVFAQWVEDHPGWFADLAEEND